MATIDERCRQFLVEIKNGDSVYKAAFAGADREYFNFIYSGAGLDFFFSVDHEIAKKISIESFRKHRDSGPFIAVPPSVRPKIESDISHLFTTRVFYDTSKKIGENHKDTIPVEFEFKW